MTAASPVAYTPSLERGEENEDEARRDLAPNAAKFLSTPKLLAKTNDRAEGAKTALSGVLRTAEAVVEAFGGNSNSMGSARIAIAGRKAHRRLAASVLMKGALCRRGTDVAIFRRSPCAKPERSGAGTP